MASELHLFPSLIVYDQVEELVSKDMQDWAKELCFEVGKHSYETRCLSTVNTAADILSQPEMQPLVEPILDCVSAYINRMEYDTDNIDYHIQSSWLNYYEPQWCQEVHTHQNSVISGTVDIIASDQFDFYIINPHRFLQPVQPGCVKRNDFNEMDARMKGCQGFIKVFSSGLLHGTRQVDTERLTLAFNVHASPKEKGVPVE